MRKTSNRNVSILYNLRYNIIYIYGILVFVQNNNILESWKRIIARLILNIIHVVPISIMPEFYFAKYWRIRRLAFVVIPKLFVIYLKSVCSICMYH